MTLYSRRKILRTGGALGAGALTLSAPNIWSGAWAQAKKLDKLVIAGTTGTLPNVLQYMAKEQGYLESFGIDAEYLNITDGNRITGSLVSGGTDISVLSGFAQIPPAVEKGAALKIVAGATLLLNMSVFAKNPAIKTVKDLEGKTVGTGSLGSLLHQLMVALLKKKGVDPAKVTFANVGSNQDVFRAVVAGVVDAGPSTIDVYSRQKEYGIHNLTDGEFWIELPEYTQQGSYTSDEAIKTKRDLLVRTLAAYAKLYRFLQGPDSKDAFVKARKAALGDKVDDADTIFQWEWIQKYKPLAVDLVLSDDRIKYIESLNIDTGAQKALVPMEKLSDPSLAKDAIKLLG